VKLPPRATVTDRAQADGNLVGVYQGEDVLARPTPHRWFSHRAN